MKYLYISDNQGEKKMNPILKRMVEYLELNSIPPTRADSLMKSGNGRLGKMISNDTVPKQNFIEKFLHTFKDANKDYIEKGEGNLTNNIEEVFDGGTRVVIQTPTEGYIPVYDVNFTLGFSPTFIDSMDNPEILGYVNFPELRGSKYVVRGKGSSMSPLINDGDFVGIRTVKNKNIIDYGNPYGIITEDLAVFKRIRKSLNLNNVNLVSDNDGHDDFEISKEEIIHLFIVVGVLSVKSVTY